MGQYGSHSCRSGDAGAVATTTSASAAEQAMISTLTRRKIGQVERVDKTPSKNSLRNEGTCSLTAKAVGTCRQAGRGVDGCEFAVGGLGRVVAAGRAVAAEGRAALSLSGSEAAA